MNAPTCVECGKTHSSHGNAVELATRGKHKGWCRSCRAKADRQRRANLNTTPCKKCGRTHAHTGTPLDIAKSGKWAGHCANCRKTALRAAKKPALPPAACPPSTKRKTENPWHPMTPTSSGYPAPANP